MRDQKTKAQRRKTKKLWDNTHALSPHPHPDVNQLPPTYPIPPPPSFIITRQWTQNCLYKWDTPIHVEVQGMTKYSTWAEDLVQAQTILKQFHKNNFCVLECVHFASMLQKDCLCKLTVEKSDNYFYLIWRHLKVHIA